MEESTIEFFCPVKTNAGKKALDHIPIELKALDAERPIVITDQHTANKGLSKYIINAFKDSGMSFGLFEGVPKTADIKTIRNISQKFLYKGFDSIIAMGAGAAMDIAKGLNMVVCGKPGDLKNLAGVNKIDHRLMPFIAVPAAWGNGFEITRYAFIENNAYTSHFLMPDLVVIDPVLFKAPEIQLMTSTGMIALTHALEACIHPDGNEFINCYAHSAIQHIKACLPIAIKQPKNKMANMGVGNAAALAGCAFSNVSPGMVHRLGKAAGTMFNIPSGQCMGIILPYGLEYQMQKNDTCASQLFHAIADLQDRGKTPASVYRQKIIDYIKSLQSEMASLKKNPIPKTLAQTDISKDSLPAIAQKAIDNGLSMDKDECIKVLTAAYDGKPLA
ncbi:MAG: Alcohol dehydrogenase [Candidatus Magnetoglobus multicellularis str. Araruama]|uniref:Alcohol dehydrogenase n=1 Tax=Candidatus Magnetoglobus multicellularis str. Araruama TaxID=890399 RepID=A0A1V1P4X2_9BACT|nr:MAG: Alcohol dehydrogenase [Candidatus Magnetoglobus multicellularis str. Araruama]